MLINPIPLPSNPEPRIPFQELHRAEPSALSFEQLVWQQQQGNGSDLAAYTNTNKTAPPATVAGEAAYGAAALSTGGQPEAARVDSVTSGHQQSEAGTDFSPQDDPEQDISAQDFSQDVSQEVSQDVSQQDLSGQEQDFSGQGISVEEEAAAPALASLTSAQERAAETSLTLGKRLLPIDGLLIKGKTSPPTGLELTHSDLFKSKASAAPAVDPTLSPSLLGSEGLAGAASAAAAKSSAAQGQDGVRAQLAERLRESSTTAKLKAKSSPVAADTQPVTLYGKGQAVLPLAGSAGAVGEGEAIAQSQHAQRKEGERNALAKLPATKGRSGADAPAEPGRGKLGEQADSAARGLGRQAAEEHASAAADRSLPELGQKPEQKMGQEQAVSALLTARAKPEALLAAKTMASEELARSTGAPSAKAELGPSNILPQVEVSSSPVSGASDRSILSFTQLVEQSLTQLLEGPQGSLVRQLSLHLTGQQRAEIRLNLQPESLGEVRLQVQLSDRNALTQIRVDNAQTAQLMEGALESFARSFSESGYQQQHFEVVVEQLRSARGATGLQASPVSAAPLAQLLFSQQQVNYMA